MKLKEEAMNSRYKYLTVLVAFSFLVQPLALANPPALRWGGRVSRMSINDCLDKSFTVMKQLGFTNVARSTNGGYVTGVINDYAADIRCTSDEILAIVVGESRDTAGVWRERLLNAMVGRSQQPSSAQRPLFPQQPRQSGPNTTKIERGHNTIETARDAGSITKFKTLKGWVGNVNEVDYWKIQIPQDCFFSLKTQGYIGTLLLNSEGETISGGGYNGSIEAGTYYIKVTRSNSNETYYDLQLSVSKLP